MGDPIYAVCGATFSPEGPSGYVALLSELSASAVVDLAAVIAFGGGAACAARERTGAFFVGLAESPRIQKWGLDLENRPVLQDELSLAGLGFSSAFRSRNAIQIIDATKAYFVSNEGIVVWNPSAMVVERELSIDGIQETGLTPALGFPIRSGERLVVPVWYRRPDRSLAPLTRLMFLDTSADTVTFSPDDRRCSVDFPVEDEAGDIYFASPAGQGVNVAFGLAGEPPAEPCVLRLRAGETRLDPTYLLNPVEIVEGDYAGAMVDGTGSIGFVLGYDESLIPITADSAPAAAGNPAWRFHGFSLDNPELDSTFVLDLPPTSGFPTAATVDGTPFVAVADGETGISRLYDMTDSLRAIPSISAPGLILQAFRLQ